MNANVDVILLVDDIEKMVSFYKNIIGLIPIGTADYG